MATNVSKIPSKSKPKPVSRNTKVPVKPVKPNNSAPPPLTLRQRKGMDLLVKGIGVGSGIRPGTEEAAMVLEYLALLESNLANAKPPKQLPASYLVIKNQLNGVNPRGYVPPSSAKRIGDNSIGAPGCWDMPGGYTICV